MSPASLFFSLFFPRLLIFSPLFSLSLSFFHPLVLFFFPPEEVDTATPPHSFIPTAPLTHSPLLLSLNAPPVEFFLPFLHLFLFLLHFSLIRHFNCQYFLLLLTSSHLALRLKSTWSPPSLIFEVSSFLVMLEETGLALWFWNVASLVSEVWFFLFFYWMVGSFLVLNLWRFFRPLMSSYSISCFYRSEMMCLNFSWKHDDPQSVLLSGPRVVSCRVVSASFINLNLIRCERQWNHLSYSCCLLLTAYSITLHY